MDEPVHSGKVLAGRYSLGARLGAGGWGAVYAAVQTDLGRPVAIKVLHTNVALAPDGLARFEREAKAAAALGHPNIAQVSDFQTNPGEPPFLVMELLTGGTLGAALKAAPGRKLAPARMAWIAYQILAGLEVAHRAGIIHRDIKPDNVFLVAMPGVEDHVKLLDFGIAKLSTDMNPRLTSTGTMLGSPAFMAPEQVKTSQVDHRVDLYAVGATMYLALSGRMPFDATTVHGLLVAILEERPTPLHELDPSMDPALSMVVARAMHKDADGRFASAGDMRRALEPWLGGVAAHASATGHGLPVISPASVSTAALASLPGSAAPVLSGPPLGSPPPGNPSHANVGSPAYGAATSPPFVAASTPHYGSLPGAIAAPAPVLASYSAPPNPPHVASSNPPYNASLAPPVRVAPGAFPPAPTGPPAPAKGNGAVIVLLGAVVGLLLLLVAGGAGAWYFFAGRGPPAPAAGGTTPSGAVPVAAGPGGAPVAASAAASSGPANLSPTSGAAVAAGKPRAAGAVAAASAAPAGAAAGAVSLAPPGPAGAAPAAVPPGGAKKQFAGTNWRIGGGSFDVFEIEPSKAAIMKVGGGISGCFAATEFDGPDHQFTDWTFQVDPSGNVKSVRRTTDFEPHPKFDACMIGALRQVKWAATKAGGSPHISFTARTRDNP